MNLLPFYKYLYKDYPKLPQGKMYFFEIDWDKVFTYNDVPDWERKNMRDIEGGYVLAENEYFAICNVRDELNTFMGVPFDLRVADDDIVLTPIESPDNRMISKKYWEDEYPMGSTAMTCGQYFKIWKKIEQRNRWLVEIDKKQLKFSFMENDNG